MVIRPVDRGRVRCCLARAQFFRRDVVMVDCDTPPATAHKAPLGTSALHVRARLQKSPWWHGMGQHIPLNGSSAAALVPASGIAQKRRPPHAVEASPGTHTKAEHFERSPDYRQPGCGAAALGPEAALSHLGGQPSAGPDASRREPATRPGSAESRHGRPRNERVRHERRRRRRT